MFTNIDPHAAEEADVHQVLDQLSQQEIRRLKDALARSQMHTGFAVARMKNAEDYLRRFVCHILDALRPLKAHGVTHYERSKAIGRIIQHTRFNAVTANVKWSDEKGRHVFCEENEG